MRWFNRGTWKATIVLAGLLAFLVLVVAVPISASARPARTVQAAPTVDVTATMTALNEEKLRQEIQQLENQNNPDSFGLLQANAALISVLLVVFGGLIGFLRWLAERRDTHDKDLKAQAEERFKTAVTALGSDNEATQVGGALLLRSFLHEEDKKIYGLYYVQIFDLAASYLRFHKDSDPSVDQGKLLPLTPIRRALIADFKEAFLLARGRLKEQSLKAKFYPQSLDASGIQLDNAYLAGADLKEIWMPDASLKGANLEGTDFIKANLTNSDFRKAQFQSTDFTYANLEGANLSGIFPSRRVTFRFAKLNNADMHDANLSEDVDLYNAEVRGANLIRADLTGANLTLANFSDADLSGANLNNVRFQEQWASNFRVIGAFFQRANLNGADLSGVDLEGVDFGSTILTNTKMLSVRGLNQEKLEACRANGAIVGEDIANTSPQPAAAPITPPQNTRTQVSSAQTTTPTSDTNGSNTSASQPSTTSQTSSTTPTQAVTPTVTTDTVGISPEQASDT